MPRSRSFFEGFLGVSVFSSSSVGDSDDASLKSRLKVLFANRRHLRIAACNGVERYPDLRVVRCAAFIGLRQRFGYIDGLTLRSRSSNDVHITDFVLAWS